MLILTRKPMATTCLPPVCRPVVRLAVMALSLLALSPLIGWAGAARAASEKPDAAASFAEFDRRARAGEELTVVFFGASLTWGANATDQALTSYRAHTKDLLEARYPKARFRCYDAAIGGTGSQLGGFRLERDVLARTPDLVFLDFSANDDNWNGTPLALASYESLLRRIIRDGRAPVVAVMFPFKWELGPGLESGTTTHLKGLSRRKEIAAAYAAPAADAAALIIDRVRKGEATPEQIWDTDGVHPGDLGYRLFAEAAFAGFEQGVRDEAVCAIPEKPLSDGPFMTVRRAVLAELFPAAALPAGWAVGKPHLTAACHDQMMSRWLDRLLIASNRTRVKDAAGKEEVVSQEPARLRFEVRASYVMVFGEATLNSGKYRVFIDGKPHTYTPHGAKEPTDLYDMTSARFNGNWNYHQMIVENLDPNVAHVLEIEPVLAAAAEQELRIESLCVAGGAAEITPLPPRAPAAGTFRETKRCGDIVCLESGERVAIASSRLRLEFDKATGEWVSLVVDGVADSLIARNKPGIALDFRVDQSWMVEEHGAKLLATIARADEAAGSLSLEFRHGVHMREPTLLIPKRWRTSVLPPMTPPQDPYEFEIVSTYTLFPKERRVERSATLSRNLQRDIMTPSFRRFEGFLFVVPGAAVGPTAECVVDVPGPVYTYNHVEPQTPYPALASTFVECRTAPDRYPGIVGVTNTKLKRSLAAWIDTKGEVYYQTYLSGDRNRISILMHDIRCSRMGDADTAVSDRQVIYVGETFPETQAEQLRSVVDAGYPQEANTPDWVPEMVMLEVMPSYFAGGLKGLAERIPFYREIGFNTIYMLPHWLGGYNNDDPFAVDPNVGTAEDLQNVVNVAHDNGMRVLFDMVIHGFSKKSPVVREHPEFFTRDEHGLLVTHFNWGTYNTDPSNPGYIDYMRRLVQHDAKTYGIDGYRVDANSYKSPNWDSGIDYPAWRASSTLPLYRAMMEAMREVNPDAVLMSEMFGPVWHSVSNLAQDANWANVMDMNAALESGKVTAASYKSGIASLQKSLPPGANRIRFCRNHDTSWFLKSGFAGYTPRLMTLDAVHALAGIFVAFAGDPKHPPSPDDDPAVWEYYRRVLALRKDHPELVRGELLLDEIVCDDPNVISFIRRLDGKASLVLANLSGEARRPQLSLHLPGHTLEGVRLANPQTGAAVSAAAEGKSTHIAIAPFEVLVGRL